MNKAVAVLSKPFKLASPPDLVAQAPLWETLKADSSNYST
jgi:hypothetical protein